MATLSDGAFRFLSLCAQPPGSAAVAQRLPSALSAVPSFDELAIAAEQHGMEPLVLAHIERTGLAIPADLRARLRARQTQHAHAAAVRARVVADVAGAMAQADVPFLVLKGAALAHLVYADPRLRPMRDVDLLIRKTDAGRALDVLMRCGFRPGGSAVPSRHHHLPGMARTLEGATVTIELHHELLARTPFVEPLAFDDVIRRSQPFEWGGVTCQTLGREDMLWHVYAHAFVINTLHPGAMRLRLARRSRARHRGMDRSDRLGSGSGDDTAACCERCTCSTIWCRGRRTSRRCCANRWQRPVTAVQAHPIDLDPDWSVGLIPVVLWPPEWWFRMRYGITAWLPWVWFRVVGHPARLALSAGQAVMTRRPRWAGPADRQPVRPD